MEALHDVVKSGKVRYIGASSMDAWQFAKAQHVAERSGWTEFVSMQNHYNLLYREEEREMLPLCADQQVAVIPWSPLARGRLTRDWDAVTARGETDEFGRSLYQDGDRAIVEAVRQVAEVRGVPRAQVALAWVLAQPEITSPIVGVTKPAQLTDAIEALGVQLTAEEIEQLEAPYQPHAVAGYLPAARRR
jgi:aryl-alcohol dehydrogenase (NADP+)